jgi:DNA-binding MarR family transcriptional regulator
MIRQEIFRQFILLEKPVNSALDEAFDEFTMTLARWKIVDYLNGAGQSTLVGIADYLSVAKPPVTRTVSFLEENGLVEQAPGSDRREKRIQLTQSGKKLYRKCRTALDEVQRRLLDGISDAEQRALLKTFMKIQDNAR